MAGFSRKSGDDRGYQKLTISSLALVAGDLVAFDRSNAKVIKATSSSSIEDLAGVVVEATTSADTQALVQKITKDDLYEAPTTNSTNTTHNYQRMVLTDENEVNNTGTDSTSDAAVFVQLYPVGATGDKKIVGFFNINLDRA